jgi:hypothetical protein
VFNLDSSVDRLLSSISAYQNPIRFIATAVTRVGRPVAGFLGRIANVSLGGLGASTGSDSDDVH